MENFAPPRGMRDFYPEDYRIREYIFNAWEYAAKIYGFEFWDAPVVESMELLERKAGEEISEQIYSFEDKSKRRLALRAELTPSLARMIINRQGGLSFPLKWASIGQCFRYERMTRGRKREHYQFNLDIIGEESTTAETEVIAATLTSLEKTGLSEKEIRVHIGSRKLLVELLSEFKLSEAQLTACYMALDKKGKVSDEEINKILKNENIPEEVINKLFRVISISSLEEAESYLPENSEALKELKEFFKFSESYGISKYLKFDISIVRGLGYYTGIVFEGKAVKSNLRTVFGGGRYNNLLSSLGGRELPCVGMGFGDVVIMELLSDCRKLPGQRHGIEYIIGYMNADCAEFAQKAAAKIRKSGKSCSVGLKPEKPKQFFKKADRNNAHNAIYIGPDELESGKITIKNMKKSEDTIKSFAELP
ncbi:MAG: histidine--tRNA ligase [Victivallales bacterium]|nr:histidine--tRNA ligase [Victivallales bacterium]MCF7889565.1 histidine--tRNA ligase [Victivallales bacterium]